MNNNTNYFSWISLSHALKSTFKLTLILFGLALYSTQIQSQIVFQESFSPSTIGPGSTSSLTFNINNQSNAFVDNIAFTNTLPAGLSIASPANIVSNCNGLLDASDGGTLINLANVRLGASSNCSITISVVSNTLGTITNTTGDLTSDAGNSGSATADLTVSADRPGLTMSLSSSTITLGATSTLTLTIDNSQNSAAASSLNFSVFLPSNLEIANPSNLNSVCGGIFPPTINTTANSLTYFLNFIPALSVCTVEFDVVALQAGKFDIVTGELFSSSVSSGFASAQLEVVREFLLKSFIDDPVIPGDNVTLEFTLNNLDRGNTATNFSFMDDLDAMLTGLVAVSLPADGFCGAGSSISGTSLLSMTGGELASGESCTFSIELLVPATSTSGTYLNTTDQLTFDLGGIPTNGNIATDVLIVQEAPKFSKEFIDDPVSPGDNVTLEYVIENSSSTEMTNISFEDIYSSIYLIDEVLPVAGDCGPSSTFTYTPLVISNGGIPPRFNMAGGSIPAQSTCTFTITLKVPDSALNGVYPSVTSDILATLAGDDVTGNAASDNLTVLSGPILRKSFDAPQKSPGDVAIMTFILEHTDDASSNDYTNITFTDDLEAFLPGLIVESPLPVAPCGTLALNGSNVLTFSAGTLTPGAEPCSFSIELTIPSAANSQTYTNTTSEVTSTSLGLEVISMAATAALEISPILFTKQFIDDPVLPGGQVTLEYVIANNSDATISNIFFSDNLGAVITGLVANGTPLNDVCGSGSILQQTSGNVFLQGGNIPGNSSCTFSVVLDVPSNATPDTYSSVSSFLSSSPFISNPASDFLIVAEPNSISLTKEFLNGASPGGQTDLKFNIFYDGTIANDATSIAFTDNLNNVLTGLHATLVSNNTCSGNVDIVTDPSIIDYNNGTMPVNTSCSFTVTVSVPFNAIMGNYLNITSSITADDLTGDPATAFLEVLDNCPRDPNKVEPGECGCGVADTDTDLDGTADCNDGCPTDPNKIEEGQCGCGVADTDTDLDGTADCNDGCPTDPNKIEEGQCGCGVADTDTDLDGTADCNDGCPTDPNKIEEGQCGCGVADTDTDLDGTADCNDNCPNDANKIEPGQCGCGVLDTDTDGDGVADCIDNCVDISNADQLDDDCDGFGNVCDSCPGGDDSIDNNADGLPDCAFPPQYADIVDEWKCGNNKVYMCHNGNTLCVNKNSIGAHINHGDYLGPCGSASCAIPLSPSVINEEKIEAFPVPFNSELNINYRAEKELTAELKVYNIMGQVVLTVSNISADNNGLFIYKIDTSNIPVGYYLIQLNTSDGKRIVKNVFSTN
jgi:uncharacterized repeat protein (TIGR01451 family)